jgi:uncharacterized protein (DUF924 family)
MFDIGSIAALIAGPRAGGADDWRWVHDFWFPPGLDEADAAAHRRMFAWWFGGGANADLPRFAPVLAAARAGRRDAWRATPRGRLSLLIVLDQFPRGLFAGTPDAYAYASDHAARRIAEEGLWNGHYAALDRPWEKTIFLMAIGHAEGPDHRRRLERIAPMAEAIAREAPERLRPLYEFSACQARSHLAVVSRFGRFPHRNAILGRASTPEEEAYLAEGDFVHMRRFATE